MPFPPYCLDCEAMLTAADEHDAPLCRACHQRLWAEAGAEVNAEEDRAWARGLLKPEFKWGRFWMEDGWVWMVPSELLDWCNDI